MQHKIGAMKINLYEAHIIENGCRVGSSLQSLAMRMSAQPIARHVGVIDLGSCDHGDGTCELGDRY
jgi:hypothetical protein